MTIDTPVERKVAARVRGSVAIHIVGELMMRLAGAQDWEFAAFGRSDEVALWAASHPHALHFDTLRAEVRQQRFTGTPVPHVGVASVFEQRRSLRVIFGAFDEMIAILRVIRPPNSKPFVARDGGGIERFFAQHGDAIASAIFDSRDDEMTRVAARRAAPLAFTVDLTGTLVSTIDEDVVDEFDPLRAHLLPVDGQISPLLRPVVSNLVERFGAGTPVSELVCVLPFALVRLAPLRAAGTGVTTLLVTLEWLRSRASLEATAARYSVSKRELQVLSAMLRGAPVAEIAAELSISESTVVFHLKRMLKKTFSKNRTELAARMLGWEIAS